MTIFATVGEYVVSNGSRKRSIDRREVEGYVEDKSGGAGFGLGWTG